MEITYENIKSLIVSQQQDGMMIKIKFQTEGQETPLETVAVVTQDPEEMKKKMMKEVAKGAAVGAGVGIASSVLGNAIGGVAGQVTQAGGSAAAGAAGAKAMNLEKAMETEVTDEKTQQAIVTAFSHLSMYYKWKNGKWVYEVPGV